MKRRQLLAAGGAGALVSLLPGCGGGGGGDATSTTLANGDSTAQALGRQSSPAAPVVTASPTARVVVVGGGMGGTTLAKYLRLWGGGSIAVTLVERAPSYTSNIMSSLVLTGQRSLGSLEFGYDTLRNRYGVEVVFAEVVAVDTAAPSVRLADGRLLLADRVVLAPGIDFEPVPGLTDLDLMPHAWNAGPQTTLLAQQLAAMPRGGVAVLTIPKTPYRCPPGPYERACLMADWMKRRKPRSKLIVLDANPDFVTEVDNFSRAFFDLHGSVIEYHTNVDIIHADGPNRTLYFNEGGAAGSVRGDVVNLIPRQRAPALVRQAGLATTPDGRFAGVNVLSYASLVAPLVHVIGDSSATTQPKAGHIANQEAKVCADALLRIFAGGAPDPDPVTNSACFSTITMTQASWLTAVFRYDASAGAMAPVQASSGASNGWNGDHFEDMSIWFRSLMADTFG